MNINYWRLFLLALGVLVVLILWRWFADAGDALTGIFPSGRHSARYNMAAGTMIAIGGWGLVRLIRNGRDPG